MPPISEWMARITYFFAMFFLRKLSKQNLNLSIILPHRLEATWAMSLSRNPSWPSIHTQGRSALGWVELGHVQHGCRRNEKRQKQHRGIGLHQAALMSAACTCTAKTVITITIILNPFPELDSKETLQWEYFIHSQNCFFYFLPSFLISHNYWEIIKLLHTWSSKLIM